MHGPVYEPLPGQVEAYAAWRTLGRPEIDREELEMSDGQLRVRAPTTAKRPGCPRCVANELAGTRQTAATHEQEVNMSRTIPPGECPDGEHTRRASRRRLGGVVTY